MRSLELNQTQLWKVEVISSTEGVDIEGFRTGEMIDTYGSPSIIFLHLYPSTGNITSQIFGKDCSFDMLAVSNDTELLPSTLLFLTEPVGEFYTTYDYMVSSVKHSLNNFNYGLEKRT